MSCKLFDTGHNTNGSKTGWVRTLGYIFIAVLLYAAFESYPALAQPKAEFIAASTADLKNPHDLKLSPDKKHLYVADVDNDRVAILDAETLAEVSSFGADYQNGTHDVDFDTAGRVYVADTNNGRILVYEGAGSYAKAAGELSQRLRGPEGVLAHSNGRIYATGAWSGNIVAFENGKVVGELKGLTSPHDIEATPDGDIWLSDSGNDRMLLLSPELEIKRELKGTPYDFNGVRYQDVLPDGTLVAADKYTHSVKVIGRDGSLLLVIGTGSPGKGPGKFRTPEGVETNGDTIFISDSGNNRVVKYRLTR